MFIPMSVPMTHPPATRAQNCTQNRTPSHDPSHDPSHGPGAIDRRPAGLAGHRAALILGLAMAATTAAACTATASDTASDTAATAPLRCEVALDPVPGGTRIQGLVRTDHAVAGTYAMTITSHSAGGSATIRQSGDFEATPGTPARLGETRMTGSPAAQAVDLQIHVDGRRLTCAAPKP